MEKAGKVRIISYQLSYQNSKKLVVSYQT
jgi:hypothetical protein